MDTHGRSRQVIPIGFRRCEMRGPRTAGLASLPVLCRGKAGRSASGAFLSAPSRTSRNSSLCQDQYRSEAVVSGPARQDIGVNLREAPYGISMAYHSPPSPSRQGRGSRKPSPLAGEGRVRRTLAVPAAPYTSAYGSAGSTREGADLSLNLSKTPRMEGVSWRAVRRFALWCSYGISPWIRPFA